MTLPQKISDYDEELTSGILPMICSMVHDEPGCNLVDLGTSTTDNCMLFSQAGARVFIDTSCKNLRSEVVLKSDLTPADIDEVLAYCPEAIDVLLFWNILDYLSLEAVDYLMHRISKVMRPGGLLYAMVSQQRYIPTYPAAINIVEENRLQFRYGPLDKEGPHYAPKQLEQRMPGFRIDKLYLMQNGVQEHLFLFEGVRPPM
ncbi:MAG: hypothetical protein U5R46_13135 [Gammaproteobacteria bacterium]|nr:hypothetical protein [Gammaproteobacteria bacterium]